MSRRDVLKFSALGAAVVALPLERVVRAKTVSQIAASKLPAPYTLPFAVPPVVDGRSGGTVALDQKLAKAGIIPGFQTTIFGYALPGQAPTTPGPRSTNHAGPVASACAMRTRCCSPPDIRPRRTPARCSAST